MKWTGLTGGIATGKTTVKKLIQSLGHAVVDADEVSHQITRTGEEGYKQIVSYFGDRILNGDQSLNRKLLGEIVFNKRTELENLEKILHPLIQTEVRKQRESLKAKGVKRAFYDVPLLFEKNMVDQFDEIVVVWCDFTTQVQRLRQRNNLSETEALNRISQQMNIIEKVKGADYCLDNSGDTEDIKQQVEILLRKLNP